MENIHPGRVLCPTSECDIQSLEALRVGRVSIKFMTHDQATGPRYFPWLRMDMQVWTIKCVYLHVHRYYHHHGGILCDDSFPIESETQRIIRLVFQLELVRPGN